MSYVYKPRLLSKIQNLSSVEGWQKSKFFPPPSLSWKTQQIAALEKGMPKYPFSLSCVCGLNENLPMFHCISAVARGEAYAPSINSKRLFVGSMNNGRWDV